MRKILPDTTLIMLERTMHFAISLPPSPLGIGEPSVHHAWQEKIIR